MGRQADPIDPDTTVARLLKHKRIRRIFTRHSWLRYIEWGSEALLLRTLWLVCARLSPERASRLGYGLLRWLGPRSHKNRHVLGNLSIMFPERSNAELAVIAQESWGNFGAVLAEFPHLDTLLSDKDKKYVDVHIDESAQRVIDEGKPSLFVVPHLANWELIAGAIVNSGVSLSAIFSPQQNPMLDRLIQRQRDSMGCRFLTKQSALRAMFRELKAGRSIGLLPDQRVDSGKMVPFFSADALTTLSPAKVALRYKCAIIPVRMERISDCRFKATFYAPIAASQDADDPSDEALRITRAINKIFAGWIRERPGQWLCMKRRWPKQADNSR